MESILTSIKKMLGIEESCASFDPDLILNINTVLLDCLQIGIGPTEGFEITSDEETWMDFLGEDVSKLNATKTLVHLNVKLLFDPPSTSFAIEAMERKIQETMFRLKIQVENDEEE